MRNVAERVIVPATITPDMGKPPAVILVNPKHGQNVQAALRAAAILGAKQLWIAHPDRITAEWDAKKRLPREERMKNYHHVEVFLADRPYDAFKGAKIIGVEVLESAQPLAYFTHPENAVYVFGPEDGSLGKIHRQQCHEFVMMPTNECMNLAGAVYSMLMDRRLQRQRAGIEPVKPSNQTLTGFRGFMDNDSAFSW